MTAPTTTRVSSGSDNGRGPLRRYPERVKVVEAASAALASDPAVQPFVAGKDEVRRHKKTSKKVNRRGSVGLVTLLREAIPELKRKAERENAAIDEKSAALEAA